MEVIANRPLPSVMADLAGARVTGSLVASSGEAKREIMFTNGEVRAARSHVEEEKLGMWLVSRGKISEDDRALILLAQGGGTSPPLGHILVTKGYVSQEQLEEELETLALTIIKRASAAQQTTCEFVDGGGEGQLDTLPNVVTAEVILSAAREFGDGAAIRGFIGSLDQEVRISGSLNDMLEDVRLTPTEGFLLSRVEGAHNVAELIRMSSLPEDQTYSLIYTLMMSRTLTVGEEGKIQRPPAPPAAEVSREEVPPQAPKREAETPEEFDFTERQLEERRYILKLSEDVTKVDHYRALGLKRDANPGQIKEAWEQMEGRFSPASPVPHLVDMVPHLERIVERSRAAYEVLSHFRARTRYDEILKALERERRPIEASAKSGVDPKARRDLVEANLKRANELIKQDELYLAIQLLEQACSMEPRPAELIKLSRLLQRNPLWVNRALACMRRAIEADPRNIDAWLELAEFWRRRNHAERQRKSLERALAIDPDNQQANQMYRDLAGNRELQRLLRRARQMR